MVRDAIRFVNKQAYLGRPINGGDTGNGLIHSALLSGKPHAIGKLGSTETLAIRKHLKTRGKVNAPTLAAKSFHPLYANAGVYPDEYEVHARYCEYMLGEVLPAITMMSVWFNLGEAAIINRYCSGTTLLDLWALDPYRFAHPWWAALAGRRVLAVHPFSETIRRQHAHLSEIWAGIQVVPKFELDCLRVPQYPTMVSPQHRDWFETLEGLMAEMAARSFDIAIIGAGAYSLPLAAHARELGKQGIHLGGGVQILFGIRGRRWDGQPEFEQHFNEHWCRPLPSDTPEGNSSVEGGCYW
jgi:hypothetical protein